VRHFIGLAHFAPLGIGIEAEITNRHPALIRYMRDCPDDELQILHPFHLFCFFLILIADLALFLRKGELFQGKTCPNLP